MAVEAVGLITIAGAPVGGAPAAYAAGELAVRPLLQAGNLLATGSTGLTVVSELVTGDTGVDLNIQSGKDGISITGEIAIGSGTGIGVPITGLGWFPVVPSWGSLGLQTIAVANDLGVGQQLGLLEGTGYRANVDISTRKPDDYQEFLPNMPKGESHKQYLPYIAR